MTEGFFPLNMMLIVCRLHACSEYSRSLGGDKELKSYLEDCENGRRRYIPESRLLNVDAGLTTLIIIIIIIIMPMQTLNILWTSTGGQSHFSGKTMKNYVIASFSSLAHVSLSVTQ